MLQLNFAPKRQLSGASAPKSYASSLSYVTFSLCSSLLHSFLSLSWRFCIVCENPLSSRRSNCHCKTHHHIPAGITSWSNLIQKRVLSQLLCYVLNELRRSHRSDLFYLRKLTSLYEKVVNALIGANFRINNGWARGETSSTWNEKNVQRVEGF